MGQAALTFLGVILGAAIAGGVSLWQVQLVTKRERETRRELREQERRDRRAAFQRETLLALHDATTRMREAVVREHERKIALMKDGGSWPNREEPLFTDDWTEVAERLLWLQARLLDKELRQLLEQLRHESANAITANSQEVAIDRTVEAAKLSVQANVRISTLMRDLF